MSALDRWAERLDEWAVPPAVLAQAEGSPWVLPRQVFNRRADRQIAEPTGATHGELVAALATPGTVLDVGSGAGAASLPLFPRVPVTAITAVDTDEGLLGAFAERAERLGVPARTVHGWWPDSAAGVEPADVVVCAHVFYNIRDLGPFVTALTDHARRRVVAEVSDRHPLTTLNPLWRRFHGITRPDGPTADDCVAALAEAGIDPRVTRWSRPAEFDYDSFADFVEVTRRRLCLPTGATHEVEVALGEQGAEATRQLVTLNWDGTSGSPLGIGPTRR